MLAALAATLGAAGATGHADAAPAAPEAATRVEAFDAPAWKQFVEAPGRPTIVVFSTTDCSHCPGVLKTLAAHPLRQRQKAPLVAVVMDLAPGEEDDALLHSPHYAHASRLMAFAGQAAALRHAVNPAWRGMTPYVALLRPGAAPRFVLGMPAEAELRAWAGAAPATR